MPSTTSRLVEPLLPARPRRRALHALKRARHPTRADPNGANNPTCDLWPPDARGPAGDRRALDVCSGSGTRTRGLTIMSRALSPTELPRLGCESGVRTEPHPWTHHRAPKGNRTLDLLLTMETLCRLSYRGSAEQATRRTARREIRPTAPSPLSPRSPLPPSAPPPSRRVLPSRPDCARTTTALAPERPQSGRDAARAGQGRRRGVPVWDAPSVVAGEGFEPP